MNGQTETTQAPAPRGILFKKSGEVVRGVEKVAKVKIFPEGSFRSIKTKKPWFSESENQTMLIEWCSKQNEWPWCWANWIFALPNGMICHKHLREQALKEGLKTGIPDLFLPIPTKTYHGMFIEMKNVYGKLSSSQRLWINFFQKRGFRCVVCYGVEQAITEIRAYLLELKR